MISPWNALNKSSLLEKPQQQNAIIACLSFPVFDPAMPLKCVVVPVTSFEQNATVLWCDETRCAAVTDPGGDLERILGVVEREGLKLEKILVTHGHIDHVGGVAELAERCGLTIEGPHRDDAFWIERMSQQGQMFGFSNARPFTPARWLEHGDTVTLGNLSLEVLHCPGHTPGHICFFHAPSRVAIVGDVLFQGSIGRTDFPKSDHQALLAAIRERLFPLGDDITFIPGHGPLSTFGEERAHNPFVGDNARW